MLAPKRQMTFRVVLPGGQDRLKQMILYVAQSCVDAARFGRVKLNKILWKSDFDSYAATGVPVTGCSYQRLELGPAPKAMLPLLTEMVRGGLLREDVTDFQDGVKEYRSIALVEPQMHYFSAKDIQFVDAAVAYYWYLTGQETSDDSHGIAWSTRSNFDPMPYEAALLSARAPGPNQLKRMKSRIQQQGLQSE